MCPKAPSSQLQAPRTEQKLTTHGTPGLAKNTKAAGRKSPPLYSQKTRKGGLLGLQIFRELVLSSAIPVSEELLL
jgi:hypothetical protein